VNLPHDIAHTLQLQENYARDPGYIKRRVVHDPRRPEFPTALWGDVIANGYVDLNKVVDGWIQECGEWSVAWDKYEEAVLFVYPHRKQELEKYWDHIQETFTAISLAGCPDRVLQNDRRVRTRVAESNRLRLSDLESFSSEYMCIISVGAALAGSSASVVPDN
jgi:hypothetical protein